MFRLFCFCFRESRFASLYLLSCFYFLMLHFLCETNNTYKYQKMALLPWSTLPLRRMCCGRNIARCSVRNAVLLDQRRRRLLGWICCSICQLQQLSLSGNINLFFQRANQNAFPFWKLNRFSQLDNHNCFIFFHKKKRKAKAELLALSPSKPQPFPFLSSAKCKLLESTFCFFCRQFRKY